MDGIKKGVLMSKERFMPFKFFTARRFDHMARCGLPMHIRLLRYLIRLKRDLINRHAQHNLKLLA